MRILHTSDWHLGRSFHGISLHDISLEFLKELIETVKEQEIDAVLVSGDIYDQAQPRTETIGLLSFVLEELSALGCTVILSSGNHDSAIRLGFASQLLARQKVHFLTSVEQIDQPVVLEKDGVQVTVFGLPYLEPRSTARRFEVAPSHRAVLAYATQKARTRLEEFREEQFDPAASILMAHCFASGSQSSESERDIAVGGIETVDFEVFRDFSYVGLGHLHGRQKLTDSIRYSGSPLAFSFSEENHRKGGWVLEISEKGIESVNEIIWKTHLELKTLRGKIDDLCQSEEFTAYESSICRIYITDDVRPLGALERLRARFATVAELYFEPENRTQEPRQSYAQRVSQDMNTQQVCENFFEHVRGVALEEAEEEYLESVCTSVQAEEVKA